MVDVDDAPFEPLPTDRFARPVRHDERAVRHRLWLAPDDAIDVDAVRAARAARTDVNNGDALGDAVARVAADKATARGTLAAFIKDCADACVRTSPFGTPTRAEVLRARSVESEIVARLTVLARHGVVERTDLARLGLGELDVERFFLALRARTPRPTYVDLLVDASLLPLVVRDETAPPTAHEMAAYVRAHEKDKDAAAQALLTSSSIPARLPEIDAVAAPLAPDHFAGTFGLFVQHVLGTQVPTLGAMIDKGLDPRRTTIVGVPYSTSEVSAQALRARGFTVVAPTLDDPRALETTSHAALAAACASVVDAFRKEAKRNPAARLLVLDDGGKAATLLHTHHKDLTNVHIVEQTARGITVLAQLPRVLWPVVDVARSQEKGHEQDKIGKEVVDAVVVELARVGVDVARVAVIGMGVIGTGVARAAQALGKDVVVWDQDAPRRARALELGFAVAVDRNDVFARQDVVIGCCGATSIHAKDLALLKSGAALASASSRNIEIDLTPWSSPLVRAQTLCIEGEGGGRFATQVWGFADKDILLLHNGFPMNFDGRIETGTAASIAPTRALMFRGAAQAVALRTPGLHALE